MPPAGGFLTDGNFCFIKQVAFLEREAQRLTPLLNTGHGGKEGVAVSDAAIIGQAAFPFVPCRQVSAYVLKMLSPSGRPFLGLKVEVDNYRMFAIV